MAKIPIKITILRNAPGNAGAASGPRNTQRVSPGTSNLGIGPRITPRTGGTTPTSLPASIGTQTTGQVPWTKSSSNTDSKTNAAYYQDEHVLCTEGARGRELHIVGRGRQLEDPPQPLRHKMPDKGKLKATLPDIKTPEDNNRQLKKKDYDRPDVIAAKNAELF